MSEAPSPNSLISHYRIVSKLGAGGMGEVWLAEDTRLGRKVALKLLPAEFTEDSDRVRRFTQEAKAASALNHPNIISVYDIGECETGRFIVMEFVAGRTLRTVIAKDNSLETFFTLGSQMARALSAAHAAGITHRDIKPDNIMVRDDGYLKMLDFGLARLLPTTSNDPEAMTLAQQTTPGTVMGTLAYMSPEQASGQTVGSASDVFALGIVLYELATGSHPFKSETMIGYLHAITSQVPPSLTSLKSHLPVALDDLILRMLDKDANSRPIADEVVQALMEIEKYGSSKTLPIRVAAPKLKATRRDEGFWIAVLPFKVRDADPDVSVLGDGLSEEIVTGLSRFRYLSVVTSTSAIRLKGEIENEQALRAKLGTRYVLEGSIRKGGSVIRISAQLFDTETGAQLWSETYNRDLQTSTVFAIQDDIAGRIVATVADSYGVLVHSMRAAMRKKDDADLMPAEWQFQYFAYREQITPSSHAELKSRLQLVAKRNEGQSDLWACLAQIYVDEYAFGFEDDATSLDRALAAGRRAVELDRGNQFALVALAQVHFFRQDLAAFGPAAERAMALNPLNTDAIGILGLQIVHTGQFERGTAIVRRAMELNPNHAGWMHFAPLWDYFHKGEYEQALECANRVDVPGLFWPYLVMASACGHLGRRSEAEAAVKDLLALDPEFGAHARSNVESWHFASGLLEPLLEGLRKAGVEISDAEPASTSSTPRLASSETRADEGFWVAVLPFKFTGSNTEVATLAEGLSEEIVTGLSRFSYLRVISRSSTLRYASETSDVRTVGRTLGARYVMEGSLRLGGSSLRVSVQLVDARTGAHVWAETYDRPFRSEEIFAVQDELVPKIVSSVADMHGALPRSMSEILRLKSSDQLSPYEALLRSFGYNERFTPEELGEVRTCLERAVHEAPANGDCWAMLSLMYANEYGHWHIHQPDSLEKALGAARTAVQTAPQHSLPYYALAQALFFHKETHSFRVAAERAVALNPMDGATAAFMGLLIAYSGDWERGCALANQGLQLNPNHPGWYHYTAWHDAYRKQDYQGALDIALKLNAPDNFYTHAVLAMCYAQLGHIEAAHKSLRDMLALKPDYAVVARELHGKWIEPDLVEQLMDGLRKAGLEIPDSADQSPSSTPSFVSSKARADEGFWVAVLPFKSSGRAKALKALAEGLSEDIITGLSRFSYLHVIARGSTLRYANQTTDLRTIGNELGARYMMEGTLRQAGTKLRLAVQLVDATTGAHLWAENYERGFSAENIFELQDDLVPRIVSTVADWYGALPHSMSESVRLKDPEQLNPYEALLRSFGYFENIAPDEHAMVRSSLKRAVEQEPGNADLWAMLSMLFGEEHRFGFNVEPDSLGRSLDAARKAVGIAHANHFAWLALAQALFFRKEFDPFRDAAERAIALNPMDGSTVEYLGHLIAFSGDWERGSELAERARQLNPNHPSWYWSVPFLDAYRKGDYVSARPFLMKGNPQKNYLMHALLAAGNAQLGESEAAARHLREVLTMMPDFPSIGRAEFSKWYLPELVDHLMDGLRKAGLEIAAEAHVSTSSPSLASSETRADEGFWVAVLPFKFTGSNTEIATLAEGLSEEIVTGLSRFSYLRVISRSSTLRYATETSDVRTVGNTLGARYVLEGSLRIAGTSLRVSVQLVDATTGAHLWVETYKRSTSVEDIFELQDDLASRIVSTIADMNGVLPHTMGEMLRQRDSTTLTPYEVVLRTFAYVERLNAEEHAEVRSALERAVKEAPNQADCLALLTDVYIDEHKQGFNVQPDSLDRALAVGRRAVAAAPSNHLAQAMLAQVLFFRRDLQGFRSAADRALTLNPMDAFTTAFMGILIAYSGDWEYGCALAEKGMELNPNHPGWYRFCSFYREYGRHEYRAALDIALKMNMPSYFYTHGALAAAYGQLGELENARTSLNELLAQMPDFGEQARELYQKWFGPGELLEDVLDGLRKAGLEIPNAEIASTSSTAHVVSSESRADEGFWVAVLPFKSSGSAVEITALAEGLSEEIVTGLSRFSYLRVIARSSTLGDAGDSSDVRAIGKTIGSRYVIEGSLRQSGTKLRFAVQLVDTTTGAHLWAENYERSFSPETVFELQDDLVPRIVSTIADQYGALVHSMSESLRGRSAGQYSAHEAVLRAFGYWERMTPEEHAEVRDILEAAVTVSPDHSDCLAELASIYWHEYAFGYNLRPDPVGRARAAAQRAVASAPTSHFAHCALATSLFFQKDYLAFRPAAERALALNRMDSSTAAILGNMIAYAGDWEYGLGIVERAMQLNPHHAGWYHYVAFCDAYRKHDYHGALASALKVNMPAYHWPHVYLAAVYGQLGEQQRASAALRELHALMPNFGAIAREEFGKWLDSELTEHLLDGLRKAGLDIPDQPTASMSSSLPIDSSSSFVSRPAIVVLPFINRSPDADNEYFSDGLTEEIISDLSVIKALRVISRNSSMSLKGTAKDTLSIGKELGVSHIVSGSVRKAGDDLRITAELVEVAGDTPLWSDKYSGTIANVFGFQEEISRKIVNALQVRLTDAEAQVIAERPIDNAAAYDCYIRARHEIYLFTAAGLDRAQKLVDSGLALIGENPLLLATRGMVSWYYLNFSIRPEVQYLDEAAAYANKALEHDPQNCFGIFLRGLVAAKRGDIESTLRDLRTAHEQRPGDSMVLNELIRHLTSAGQELTESARPAYAESLRLDPLHPLNWAQAAWRHFNAGRLAESMGAARRIFQLTDRGNPARVYAAYYLAIANVREEAIQVLDAEEAALAGTAYGSMSAFLSRALQGDAEGAVKHVTPQLEQAASWTEYLALLLADGYSLIGDRDAALKWLRTAVAQGFINYPYLATRDPFLVNVRHDPRFVEFIRGVKTRWEALTQRSEESRAASEAMSVKSAPEQPN